MKLYAPTKILRATVGSIAMVVLAPEESAPAGSVRRVQLVMPGSPDVHGILDEDPAVIAMGRVFEWPPMPSGQRIPMLLLPEQFLVLCAKTHKAHVLIIVEHQMPEVP